MSSLNLQQLHPKIKYVLFASTTEWRVSAVPNKSPNFTSRKALPEPWRGLRGEQLQVLTGVADAVFVHPSGFIGGARSFEGALQLASLAIKHA